MDNRVPRTRLVGYTAAEYDALLVVWKEKVRHDLVRPTTVIQGTRPERMVRTCVEIKILRTARSTRYTV